MCRDNKVLAVILVCVLVLNHFPMMSMAANDTEEVVITGTHLSLGGNIGVHFHVDLSNLSEPDGVYMKFRLPNGTTERVMVSDAETDSTGQSVFLCEVSAKDMTGTITAQMLRDDGTTLSEAKEISVYDNASYIIENSQEDASDYQEVYKQAKLLAAALLNYGAYVQQYLRVNVDKLANVDLSEEEKDVSDVTAVTLDKYMRTEQPADNNIGIMFGANLGLQSQTTLAYYFKLAEGVDVENLTFTCGREELQAQFDNGYYVIKIEGIGARDINREYRVKVSDGTNTLVASYSVLAYAYNVLDRTGSIYTEKLKDVLRALYKYNYEADSYSNNGYSGKVFYYNDFEDTKRELDEGASIVVAGDNTVALAGDNNSYLKLDFKSEGNNCYFQPTISGASTQDKIVMEMELSTDSNAPTTTLQYPYSDGGKNTLFSISKSIFGISDNVKVGTTTVATISSGSWIKLGIILDCSTGKYQVYIYDHTSQSYEQKAEAIVEVSQLSPKYMRFYVNTDSSTSSLLVDNLAIYTGDAFFDVSGNEEMRPIVAMTAPDVEITYAGTNNYTLSPEFSQSAIDDAINHEFTGWPEADYDSEFKAEKSSIALYYLILASRMNSQAKHSTQDITCVDKAVANIKSLVSGGNEPFACVGSYWGHAVVASALALAKDTDVIYDSLDDDTKARMDWLMKALAVAGNWGYNDKNNYVTGTDFLGNFNKSWNPNFKNAYLSIVLSATMYFSDMDGGLDAIYQAFDYDTYIKKFQEYGFTNILNKWIVKDEQGNNLVKELMNNGGSCTLAGSEVEGSGGTGAGVKIPFEYNGCSANSREGRINLFSHLAEYTYAWAVLNEYGTPNGDDYAYILSGESSPYLGQMGMMREFAASDSKGTRSSVTYCYDSWLILVPVYTNMKIFGDWNSGTSEMKKMDRRILVGNEDLLFKLNNGYYEYRSGAGYSVQLNLGSRGRTFLEDIWKTIHYSAVQ